MTRKVDVDNFLAQKTLAIVGVSRSKKKFSFKMYQALKSKGYQMYPVNPNTDNIDGNPCFKGLASLPEEVDGVVIVTPPEQTKKIIKDAVAAGVKHIWIQQGAESEAALEYCTQEGINVIHNECILMFAEPATFPHNVHRFIWNVVGKAPK